MPMNDEVIELQLLEQKVQELIARYKSLQSENSALQNQIEALTEKNQNASSKVRQIIANLQSINQTES